MVQKGEAVGVIVAQSNRTRYQFTLQTFHVGGIASNITTESRLVARYGGIAEIEEM